MTDTRTFGHTLVCLDTSIHDEGESKPIPLTIKVGPNDIIIDVEGDPKAGGDWKRSIWIEVQGSKLAVHCYDPQHEEPINVYIGVNGTTVGTDREGGLFG